MTTFVDVCSNGYTTVSTTYTATYEKPSAVVPTPKEYPEGFTTTIKYCATGCGVSGTYVTVTVPCTETSYDAVPTSVGTPYDVAQPTGSSYDNGGDASIEFPFASSYQPGEGYTSEVPAEYPSSPSPYEPDHEQPSQGHGSYPEDEETAIVYATQVVTLSVVPVPASEDHASLSSAALPAEIFPAGQPFASYHANPSAGHPVYPSSNDTVGYSASTGAGAIPSKTGDGDVPLFTGAAVTLKINGPWGGVVVALFALLI